MVARFSITSAVDAQAVCALDLIGQITGTPGAPQIIFGVIGSLSTAFFSFLVQDNGGAVNASGVTTVPVDTAMHVWEVWNDGTTITFMIDGVQVATAAASGAGTNPCAPSIFAGNGTTAAARTIDADYLYFCTGDPA
jgi:hypothetical protein